MKTMVSSQIIYNQYPNECPPIRSERFRYRYQSLQEIHSFVLRNFIRKMNCSIEDINDIKYSISSIKNTHNNYDINALTVYMFNGFSYTFTRNETQYADGRLSDISYDSYMSLPYPDNDDEYELDWAEYRVIHEEVTKLSKRIEEVLSIGIIEGDIIVSVPPTKSSFIKHHKDLVKIDRRRKVPEIYKEWDQTIHYYPITLMNSIDIEDTYDINAYNNIGWSADD